MHKRVMFVSSMPKKSEQREKVLHMRFSAEELRIAKNIAEQHGLTTAGVFRMLLRKEHRALRENREGA
jgi:hypothetical protein